MYHWTDLPDHTRVWVYQSNRALSDSEIAELKEKCDHFVTNWASHGTDLKAAIEIFHNRFVVVFVDEQHASASGCSIDSSVHFVQEMEAFYNITLMDRLQVAWREGQEVKACTQNEFEEMLKSGLASADTVVFNNMVATKADFEKGWEVPVSESWHKQLA